MKKRLIYLAVLFLLPISLVAQLMTLTPVLPTVQVRANTNYTYRFTLTNNFNASIIAPGTLKITSSDLSILTSQVSGQNGDLLVRYTGNNVGATPKTGTLKVSAQYLDGGNVTKVLDLLPITISITINPTVFYNARRTAYFQKKDCGNWYLPGNYVEYIVEANKYSSYISQSDVEAKAQQDIDQNGQNYANLNGTCVRENAVRTPKGTRDYEWSDYKEDIIWDNSRILGPNVKIERVDSNGNEAYTVLIAASVPNNGLLVNGLNKTLLPGGGRIRITALQSGTVFLSDIFVMDQD
jgi:hypothetical protein